MSIGWRVVTGGFEDSLYEVLKAVEAPNWDKRRKLAAEVDTPTIGIGFDLKAGSDLNRREVLRQMGLDVGVFWDPSPVGWAE